MEKADELMAALVQQHSARLTDFACRMTGDREDAKDVVSETWQAAWVRMNGVRGAPTSWSAYLFTVAKNRAATILENRRRWGPPITFDEQLHREVVDEFGGLDSRLEQDLRAAVIRAKVSADELAIVILPDRGLTDREIAKIVRKPYRNISSIRRRTLAKLRTLPGLPRPKPVTSQPDLPKG